MSDLQRWLPGVISLCTGQELLTLPFAVVALFRLFINWSYLRHAAIG